MTAATGHTPCSLCRGRGWKFGVLRRSLVNGGGAAERGLLRRARVICLACSGSGRAAAQ
jgi:hypothetical protein